jgi:hypothetical protein
MKLRLTSGIAIAALFLGTAVMRPRAAAPEIAIAGRTNANPSLAANGRFVALAWGAAGKDGVTDIYVTVSRDAGNTFTAPVQASNATSRASLSGEQPPRVALVPRQGTEPAIVVVWTTKGEAGTRIVSAESRDGGKTFAGPTLVPGTDAKGNRGWESVAIERDGRVAALWLDHRETASGGMSGAHAGHAAHQPGAHAAQPQTDGVARAQLSKLFFGRVSATAAPTAITGGVCYCCKTALVAGADGSLYAAWRHVYPGNRRDIAFTVSRDAGRSFSAPVRISEDQWQLDGCPENGPALAVDTSNRVHVVWPTLVQEAGRETLALFYAMSRDGRTFTPRVRIPSAGAAYHPQLTLSSSGTLVVAWEQAGGGPRRIRLAEASPVTGGTVAFRAVALPGPDAGTYPTLASTPDGIVAVWTSRPGPSSSLAVARVTAR